MRNILVVEDDVAVQRGLRESLEREGYRVFVARDGAAGMVVARRQPLQLAILDVMLPSMTGFELCRRLKGTGFAAPVFLLTGLSDEKSRLEGLGAGADDYIQKPFSVRELLLRIRNAFEHSERLLGRAKALERDLEKAREIQLSSLPADFPRLPGIEIFGRMRAAAHVGGDYFDFVRMSPTKVLLLVADVSGKGMPAALYVHTMQGIVRASSSSVENAKDILCRLQVHLGKSMEAASFVTAVAAMIDMERRTVEIASAGHLPVLFRRGGKVTKLHPEGFVIGQIGDERFVSDLQQLRVDVRPGDVLTMYTDGLVESFNSHGEEFGFRRLERYAALSKGSAREIVQRGFDAIEKFSGDAPQSDDITVLAVRIL